MEDCDLGVPYPWVSCTALDSSYLYACTSSDGIFRSQDYGETWEPAGYHILIGDIPDLIPVDGYLGLLFKIFADIDVFDIEVDATDVDLFVNTVKAIAPTFGGINLEDIKAPECFEIERRLKEELKIPLMHDDQHGTAIISSAALLNACEVAKKNISKVKIVVNGAGASAISCTKLYISRCKKENIIMVDSKGVLTVDRDDLDEQKKFCHHHQKCKNIGRGHERC